MIKTYTFEKNVVDKTNIKRFLSNMENELKYLRKLYPINSEAITINLKESDIDSLSILLLTEASYEYIVSNLLSKRKFNILNKIGVFECIPLKNNKLKYKVSSIYTTQIRNIYVKYYGTKFKK